MDFKINETFTGNIKIDTSTKNVVEVGDLIFEMD